MADAGSDDDEYLMAGDNFADTNDQQESPYEQEYFEVIAEMSKLCH